MNIESFKKLKEQEFERVLTIKLFRKHSQGRQSKMKINFITYYNVRSSAALRFKTFGRRSRYSI